MPNAQDTPNPCMAISDRQLKLEEVQAAMKAMMDQVLATSETPAVMAIVDAAGNLEAFAKMDNARVVHSETRCPKGILSSHPGHRHIRLGRSHGEYRP